MTIPERLANLEAGRSPLLIARMKSGFAVMADSQYLPGYCILLAYPEVSHLTDLPAPARSQFLMDMSLLGEAVAEVTECARVNYAILANIDPFVHAHVWPRYKWEEDRYRLAPPSDYPPEFRNAPEHQFDPAKHAHLQSRIAQHLLTLTGADLTP